MTDEQLKAFAEYVIRDHAKDVEYLSIFEMADESPLVPGGMLEDEDARKVADLIRGATVTVTWEATS